MKESERPTFKANFRKETYRFYRYDINKCRHDAEFQGQIFFRKDRPVPEELVLVLDGAKKLKPKKIETQEEKKG